MSFLADVKQELYKIKEENICCRKSELYAILLFSKFFYKKTPSFKAKDSDMADLFSFLTSDSFYEYFKKEKEENKEVFTIKGQFEKRKLFAEFGYNENFINLGINEYIFEQPCCISAFLRGVFLVCANISDPSKEYNIVMKVYHKRLASDLFSVISKIGPYKIKPKMIEKRGYYIISITESSSVEDFLIKIGATNSSMEVMQQQMIKCERNHINRMNNFDTANIKKSAKASADQLNAIKKIKEKNAFDNLKDNLKFVAELRTENPDLSLEALSNLSGIKKANLHYRLSRLIEISKKL